LGKGGPGTAVGKPYLEDGIENSDETVKAESLVYCADSLPVNAVAAEAEELHPVDEVAQADAVPFEVYCAVAGEEEGFEVGGSAE